MKLISDDLECAEMRFNEVVVHTTTFRTCHLLGKPGERGINLFSQDISVTRVTLGTLGAAGVSSKYIETVESPQLEEVSLPLLLAELTHHLSGVAVKTAYTDSAQEAGFTIVQDFHSTLVRLVDRQEECTINEGVSVVYRQGA